MLEYISENYALFLGGTIIILLAIIGSYADKTNFGQGKIKPENDKKEKPDKIDLKNKKLGDLFISTQKNISQTTKCPNCGKEIIKNFCPSCGTKKEENSQNLENDNINISKLNDENINSEILEKSENKFDREFKELIPDKGIIDDDLLNDIDDMNLDNEAELKSFNIPDLDDVDLPEIKNIKEVDEDIWKL